MSPRSRPRTGLIPGVMCLELLLVVAGSCSNSKPAQVAGAATPAPARSASPAAMPSPPYGFAGAGGQWLRVAGSGGSVLVNVQSPAGAGPLPVVVYLPGQAGLTPDQVRWAARLAAAGYLVLLGCPPDSSAAPACRPGPPLAGMIDQLITTALLIAGARRGQIGLFGVSAGGPMVLSAAANRADRGAVVVDFGRHLK